MSTAAAPLMTAEEMLALPPDNGMDRDLIEGRLRERPIARRGRPHSETTIACGTLLRNWLLLQPVPRGSVLRSGNSDLPGFQMKVADLFV